MSDIGLLMAGVLTTGQPSLPPLPEEPAIQPDEAVQELEKANVTSVSANDIAPPELTLERESNRKEGVVTRKSALDSRKEGVVTREPTVESSGKERIGSNESAATNWARSKEEKKQGYPEVINLSPTPPTSTTPQSNGMSQVTSVSQLKDVEPNDWAFGALRSLTEQYKCITPSEDGTFKGNRAMTRYEFAVGLNACIEKVRELIATNTENLAKKEDLITLEHLQGEFQTELTEVKNRVDSLEERSAKVEAKQFSATTKLYGQAIFSVQGTNEADVFLYKGEAQPRKAKTNPTFTASSQLTFATSFTGRDLLLTGLSAGNLGASTQSVSTNMGRLGFESDTSQNLVMNELSYRFPISDNLGVVVGTAGINPVNTFRGINPLEGSGDGAISLFGQRNPILAIGSGTGGVGFDWQVSDRISLQAVYSAQIPGFPGDTQLGGLLGGNYTAGTQLTFAPTENVDVGVHYLFNHSPDGNLRTGIGDTQLASPFVPQTTFDTHAVGATATWRVNPNLQLGGWGGWTTSKPFDVSGRVETTNWAVFAALPNLFRPGNLGGVVVGQPPKITSSTLPDGYNLPNFAIPNFETGGGKGGREDTSLHLELFYRAQINDNISLTPGLFMIFNPNHNAANDALVVAAMRATFRF
jgi:Carbohydrate-selective porin, OprB family/S-layer homology domain